MAEEMTPRQRAFYQGLFGLGAGILANNAPSRVPGGGMRALGKGLQQGLQTFNQALTMEEKMDALREERALKGELEERIPDLIAQARLMGVDEGILRSAELMASVKPSSVVATLNNAMVKAQKDPRPELTSEQLIYTDPTSKRQFRIKSDGYLGEEIKALPEEKIESSPFSMSRSEVMRSPSLSIYANQMGPNDILQVEPGKLPSILRAPEAQTTPGQVQPLSDEEKQRFQGMDISSKIIDPETGLTTFYNSLNRPVTEIPEEKSSPFTLTKDEVLRSRDYADFHRVMGDNDILQVSPNGETQIIEAKKVEEKTEKEKAGFKYIGRNQEGFPTNAPADADEVELSPTGQRTFFKGGFPLQAPETKPVIQKFEYINRTDSEKRYPALYAQMGENDAIEVNPETGKAEIIYAPGADSEDLEYREIVSADGKTIQQGYYSKEKGLVLDLGKTPRNLDKGLETKDKLKFLIDRHKKPSDRLQAMVSNYESISTAVGAGKPFDDLALIFYIAKMLDPTSVVREGEQMIIRNTGALPDKFISYFTRLKDGKAFTKDQRRNILEFAKRKMDAELKTYNQVVDGVKRDAGENRFNLSYENEVVPALGIIHDKMDTNKTFKKVMDSIDNLEDPLGGEEKLNTEGDSGLKQIIFDAVNEAIDARSSDKPKKKTVLSNEEGDSILE